MLADSAYGKSRIRVLQVQRHGSRHTLADLTVAVRFDGDFETSYTEGDNTDVLPTDTMKNTVYALAARQAIRTPEELGLRLGRHFLGASPKLRSVRIDLTAHAWGRLIADGEEAGTAFVREGPHVRTATVLTDRSGPTVSAGLDDLLILKSAHSAFEGFPRDPYTTLPDARDRLLATSLTANWQYRMAEVDFDGAWSVARGTLLDVFARHHSKSVQHTLYAMGRAVLDRAPEVERITLVMPNRHHLPVDLSPFGLENRNEVFVPTEEPQGLIEATIVR